MQFSVQTARSFLCFVVLMIMAGRGLAAPVEDVKAPEKKKAGISVLVATLGNKLIVQRVIPGGPADKAGIQAMDEIVQIEQDWIAGMSAQTAISHLRGDPDTPVQLFVRRQDRPDLLKFVIVRKPLPEQPPIDPGR